MGGVSIRQKPNCICIYIVDNDRQHLDLGGLIKKLRQITRAVQLMPFIYGGFYVLSLTIYITGTEEAATLCDTLFYVSPIVAIEFLILSRLLKEIVVQVDIFVYMFSVILLLVSAYKVFLC